MPPAGVLVAGAIIAIGITTVKSPPVRHAAYKVERVVTAPVRLVHKLIRK